MKKKMERSDDQNSEGSKSGDEFGLESIFCRFREDTRRIVNSESKKNKKGNQGRVGDPEYHVTVLTYLSSPYLIQTANRSSSSMTIQALNVRTRNITQLYWLFLRGER